jgi:hypothetical protein
LPPRFQEPAVRAAPYAPYAAIAVISIVVGVAIGHSGKRTPPAPPSARVIASTPAPAPVPAPAPAARPEPDTASTAAKVTPPPPAAALAKRAAPVPTAGTPTAKAAPTPAAAPRAPVAAAEPAPSGDCIARVVTEPKDAKVIWGGAVIGRSPIDGARVPCGPATVTIERERWQPLTVDVNAQAGVTAKVHERLRRPRTALAVTSTPPGAQISINHVAAGAAPKRLEVQRFEQVQIRATLKGYQPWNKAVYLKEPDAKLDIQLVPRK